MASQGSPGRLSLGRQEAPQLVPAAIPPALRQPGTHTAHSAPSPATYPRAEGVGTGPYRTPDGHRLATRVHSHHLGLIARAVDAEALPLILQQDDLGNTQAAVRERAQDRRPRPGLGSIFNLLGARLGLQPH